MDSNKRPEKSDNLEKTDKKDKLNIAIPQNEIYKVHQMDSHGKVMQTIIFAGASKTKRNLNELFSDIEIAYIEANQIKLVFSDLLLHSDDTICTIKKKIMGELIDKHAFSYEEIYLFSAINETVNLEQIYQNIVRPKQGLAKKRNKETANIPQEFVAAQFGQFVQNLNIPDTIIEDIATKDIYEYEDLLLLGIHNTSIAVKIPLGQKFMNNRDYLFSPNPYDIRNISTSRYEMTSENPLITFENELLLNYGNMNDKNLYLCLAENVFEYAFKNGADEAYIACIYFPLLFNENIKTGEQLTENKPKLLKASQSLLTAASYQLYKTVDMFYNIYYGKTDELSYIERGIQQFSIVIRSGLNTNIPLESIFKNIHATKEMPIIKYNPGNRRENMFRLYSTTTSKNGKKIPVLSELAINKLSREMGKGRQISMHILATGLFVDFESDGSIFIRATFAKSVSYDEWNTMIISQIKPVIEVLNGILRQTGFVLPLIESLKDNRVEILNIKYVAVLPTENILSLQKYANCISSIFDIIKDDLTKTAILRFKRVENFKEMDAQSVLITEVLHNTHDYQEVARILMLNYSISQEAAILRIAEYTEEHQQLAGRVIENPGFPVRMFHPPAEKKVVIEVDSIVGIDYIEVLHIYLDSILRIIQSSKPTTTYPVEHIRRICSKTTKFDKNVDKSHIENVVAISGVEPLKAIKKIQPLAFQFDDDADEIEDTILGTNINIKAITNAVNKPADKVVNEDNEGFYIDYDEEVEGEEFIKDSPSEIDTDYESDLEPELKFKQTNNSIYINADEPELESEIEIKPKSIKVKTPSPSKLKSIKVKTPSPSKLKSINLQLKPPPKSNEDENEDEDEDEGFYMDYEEEEEDEKKEEKGGEGEDEISPSSPQQQINIEGMPLYPNPFLRRLKDRDPTLFLTKQEGKYKSYTKSCAANISRQPVILTEEEKANIDKTNPGSYHHAVKYGSDPENPFWYICPRYWCLATNSSITEEDVKAGKCGTIIPADAKTVPKGAGVYEFNSKTNEHINPKGEYIHHYPSFFEDATPNGNCVPCCFKMQQNDKNGKWEMSNEQIRRRERCSASGPGPEGPGTKGPAKFISYIINSLTIPLPSGRWGFLPISAQLFLKTNNAAAVTKLNSALIRPNTPCLLRYGTEQVLNQSFLGCIANLYAYKQSSAEKKVEIPAVKELRQIMVDALTIDLYIKYHNGSLVAVFKPKLVNIADINVDKLEYTESVLGKSINVADEAQYDFLVDTIASFENFKKYLLDEKSSIDHTYLWDMIIGQNPKMMRDGLNLIILETPNTDITDKIELVCPTNSYSQMMHDPRKETVIILKQGEFYEPIFLYEERDNQIHELKTFMIQDAPMQNIKDILEMVQNVNKSYCAPQSSRPTIYEFTKNNSADELYRLLKTYRYDATQQIANFQGKTIGLLAKHDDSEIAIFVPCFPSAVLSDLAIKYMDTAGLWTDFNTTKNMLMKISRDSKHKILCEPRLKVLEDGLIVGIITETNQFVQIEPPSENIAAADELNEIELTEVEGTNYNNADKVVTTSRLPDINRQESIKKIALESNFFTVFRTTIRNILNQYENRTLRKKIMDNLDIPGKMYKQRLKLVIELLRELVGEQIDFQDFELSALMAFDQMTGCSANCDKTTQFCMKEGEKCTLIIPSKHLISGLNNEMIYYSRVADELIRYKRIRLFMFQPNFYLNITDNEYKVEADEFLALQSLLGSDYFKDLIPFNANPYVKNVTYDMADPSITQTYSNEVALTEQDRLRSNKESDKDKYTDFTIECIQKRGPIIGHTPNSMWKRSFPKTAEEIIFKPTVACSYYPIISIMQEKFNAIISVKNVKDFLWKGYEALMGEYSVKIINILKSQGKKNMMDRLAKKQITMETLIFSEEYYITDLDIWILAKDAQLPVILFSSTKLKQLSSTIEWLFLGGNVHDNLYFIRSPALIVADTAPEYHLVSPALPFTGLKEFRVIMEAATKRPMPVEYSQNMQTLDNYLKLRTDVIIKRNSKV